MAVKQEDSITIIRDSFKLTVDVANDSVVLMEMPNGPDIRLGPDVQAAFNRLQRMITLVESVAAAQGKKLLGAAVGETLS